MTVDPARRLANALGLESMLSVPTRVPLQTLEKLDPGTGELWAMMVDTREVFDRVVDRHAPDRETRDRIYANPYYEQAAGSLAGSQEYMAMEQLYELHEEGGFDLLILDTPPSQHALDFLEAPIRLQRFFDNTVFKAVMGSSRVMGKIGKGLLRRDSVVFKGLNRFVGADVFASILEFLQGFGSMTDGFVKRAIKVQNLLESEAVSFVIMTGPDSGTLQEGMLFQQRLKKKGLSVGQFVINRIRPSFVEDVDDGLEDALSRSLNSESHREQVLQLIHAYQSLANADQKAVENLRGQLGDDVGVSAVAFFERELHDLPGLYAFQQQF